MNIFRKNNGAISVFLVIILVPCMLASSLFVDLGRVHLSQSMAESSSDLALSGLLTNYDRELKDFYGLAASCQSIDEFYDVSVDYFETTMAAQGLSADDIVLLSDYFTTSLDAAMKETEGISNLLETEVIETTITPVDKANMANATMLKDGIVEFMKYRAPVEIMRRTFFEKLVKTSSKEDIEKAEKDKELTEKKETFYDAEYTFNDIAYEIYSMMKTYNSFNLNEDTVKSWEDQLNSYEEIYKEAHGVIVRDLMNTDSIAPLNRVTYLISSYPIRTYFSNFEEDDDQPEYDGDTYEKDDDIYDNDDYNFATEQKLKGLLEDTIVAIKEYNTAKSNLEQSFLAYSKGEGSSNTYDIQYWGQSYWSVYVKLEKLNEKAVTVIKKYNAVENALSENCMYKNDRASYDNGDYTWTVTGTTYDGYSGIDQILTTKQHYEKIKAEFNTIYNSYISVNTKDENSSDKYTKYMSILERISNDYNNKQKINASTNILKSTGKNIDDSVKDIYTEITDLRYELSVYNDWLALVIKKLDNLDLARIAYEETYAEWKEAATSDRNLDSEPNMDTELAAADRAEMFGEGGTESSPVAGSVEASMGQVTKEQIDDMKERIQNIIDVFTYFINVIDNLKYNDKPIKEISSATIAIAKSGVKAEDVKLTNGEIDTYISSTFNFTKLDGKEASIEITTDNNPNFLTNPIPELYKWMQKRGWDKSAAEKKECSECGEEFDASAYGTIDTTDAESTGAELPEVDKSKCPKCMYEGEDGDGGLAADSDSAEDGYKEDASTSAKDISGLKDYGTSFPSDFDTDGVSIADMFTGLFEIIGDLATDFGLGAEDLRDALYSTEYVFGMFSHAAYENEAKYKLVRDNLETLGLTDTEFYKLGNIKIKDYYGKDEVNTAWENEDPTIRINKSLTNKMINAKNNYAYGAEIEYILKGGESNKEALNDIYGNIYATRFVTNTVTGFLTFWKYPKDSENKEVQVKQRLYSTISSAVNKATYGIVPSALVLTVLILIEVGIETALDMSYLKAGIPVKFIKEKGDVNWGFTRVIETEKNAEGKLEPKGLYIQYSDYLYIFTFVAFTKDDCMDGLYRRVGDLIQANMTLVTGKNSYELSKAVTHFKFNSTLRVSPLMVTLPIFGNYDTGLDKSTDWCTYNIEIIRGY